MLSRKQYVLCPPRLPYILLSVFTSVSLQSVSVHAEMAPEQYRKAADLANRRIQQGKAEAAPLAGALTSASALRAETIGYRKGEKWNVAVYRSLRDPSLMIQTTGKLKLFSYEVVDVDSRGVVIEVRESAVRERRPVDENVKKIEMKLDSRGKLQQKSYYFKDRRDPVVLAGDRIGSKVSELERYPLDPFAMANNVPARCPEGPSDGFKEALARAGINRPVIAAPCFEQNDAFGTPAFMSWEPSAPFPAYVQTPQGEVALYQIGGAQ